MNSFAIPYHGREKLLLVKEIKSFNDQDYDLNLIRANIVTRNIKFSEPVLELDQQMSVSVLRNTASNKKSDLIKVGVKLSKGDCIPALILCLLFLLSVLIYFRLVIYSNEKLLKPVGLFVNLPCIFIPLIVLVTIWVF